MRYTFTASVDPGGGWTGREGFGPGQSSGRSGPRIPEIQTLMGGFTLTASAAATAKSENADGRASAPPQHLRALARANEVRLARAALKRSVGSRETSVAEVVDEVPWEAETMTLSELLTAQPRWGRTRTRKLLGSLGLSENKRLGTLTDRQRSLLVERLAA